MDDLQELILSELRETRSDIRGLVAELRSFEGRISALEADNYSVMGNGQPGRLTSVEKEVKDIQHWRWRLIGISSGVSVVAATLISALAKLVKL